MIELLQEEINLPGWRKIKAIRRTIKSLFRPASQQVFRGKKEEQKKQGVKAYLQQVKTLIDRCEGILNNGAALIAATPTAMIALLELEHYKNYAIKLIDLTQRRLIKDEVIPACKKIYSIFEPHTEWITKGKLNKKAELGHLLLITTDQHQFIVDYKVMEGEKDAAQIPSLTQRIEQKFKHNKIYSHSFDKGFYSKDNFSALQQAGIQQVIMPEKGKPNKEEKEREAGKTFKQLRYAHSAVV
jgi:IS5 family transposase